MHVKHIALAAALVLSINAHASEELAQKAGCTGCHKVDGKLVGPAYKDVAAKYKGQKDAPAKLIDHVRKGSTGVWGTIPMPPTPEAKVGNDDLKKIIDWVLKQ